MDAYPEQLVRLAQLIRHSAELTKAFSDSKPETGYISRVTQLSRQIEAAAIELMEIGRSLERVVGHA